MQELVLSWHMLAPSLHPAPCPALPGVASAQSHAPTALWGTAGSRHRHINIKMSHIVLSFICVLTICLNFWCQRSDPVHHAPGKCPTPAPLPCLQPQVLVLLFAFVSCIAVQRQSCPSDNFPLSCLSIPCLSLPIPLPGLLKPRSQFPLPLGTSCSPVMFFLSCA